MAATSSSCVGAASSRAAGDKAERGATPRQHRAQCPVVLLELLHRSQQGLLHCPAGAAQGLVLGPVPAAASVSRVAAVEMGAKKVAKKAMLEVEYFSEEGTGLGPTLEFYTIVSSELRKLEHGLWLHESDGAPDGATHVHAPHGLLPRPIPQRPDGSALPTRVAQLFSFMGRLVAKALLDNRLVVLRFRRVSQRRESEDRVRTYCARASPNFVHFRLHLPALTFRFWRMALT
mgnify:CR=1 FL=1